MFSLYKNLLIHVDFAMRISHNAYITKWVLIREKMIIDFKDKETEKIWNHQLSKKIPKDITKRALDKLYRIHTSSNIEDLRTPPSNHLEKLQGDREGQYSIRINQQWRICFVWTDNNNAKNLEIIDYH